MKISLITVTYNAQKTLSRCIQSVIAQNYANLEYIIIDGASTDGTLQIISQYQQFINVFISGPDSGIYDAMNKGVKMATGDVVGILNADDFFADTDVLHQVADAFETYKPQILYGNLNYLNPAGRIIRKWRAGGYGHGRFDWGWMPPHPTFYCKRELFSKFGLYDTSFGTAADYELMLRFIHLNRASTWYLDKVMVNMSTGGVSNKSYQNRLQAWGNDYKAMGKNGVQFPRISIIFKPIRKIFQFI